MEFRYLEQRVQQPGGCRPRGRSRDGTSGFVASRPGPSPRSPESRIENGEPEKLDKVRLG